MEQTLIFILGAIFTLGLIGLWYSIYMVIKMNKIIDTHQKDIESLHSALKEVPKAVEARIENVDKIHHSRMNDISIKNEEFYKGIDERLDEVYEEIVVRIDKLSSKKKPKIKQVNS